MFCTKCGKEIADDSKFCRHCGFSYEKPQKESYRKEKIKALARKLKETNFSLKTILLAIAVGIWMLVLQNLGILPVSQNVKIVEADRKAKVRVYGDVSVDGHVSVDGSVDVDNTVDVSIVSY